MYGDRWGQLASDQAHHTEHQPHRRSGLGYPEKEHPACDARLEPGHSGIKPGVEPREVELVQLSKIGPVGRIHLVELVYEVIRQLVAELFVELPGQFRRDGHGAGSRSGSGDRIR